jgi:hypothetical protein
MVGIPHGQLLKFYGMLVLLHAIGPDQSKVVPIPEALIDVCHSE